MTKIKFAVPVLLLGLLILTGFGCQKSPEAFYKKFCNVAIDFQKEAEDVLEYYEPGEEYDDVDDCVDDLVEQEEDLYDECMDEEDDEAVCEEAIGNYREMVSNMLTRDGCKAVFGFYCGMPSGDGIEDFNECMSDLEGLCDSLPKNF